MDGMDDHKPQRTEAQAHLAAQGQALLDRDPELRDELANAHAEALAGRLMSTVSADELLSRLNAEAPTPDLF